MPDIRPPCKTCDYFNLIGTDPDGNVIGACQRRAPVAANIETGQAVGRDIEALIPFAVWPRVLEDSWCGEHSLWNTPVEA